MSTLTTVVEGARVVATTPTIFRTRMNVTATDRDGTVLGTWMLPARHWMEEVAPLIVDARRQNQSLTTCWCEHDLCCRVHGIHVSPHRNCIMR